jgi:hypothetical protein
MADHIIVGIVGDKSAVTIDFLRRTTNDAAGRSLGNTTKHLRRTTRGAAGNGLDTPR